MPKLPVEWKYGFVELVVLLFTVDNIVIQRVAMIFLNGYD